MHTNIEVEQTYGKYAIRYNGEDIYVHDMNDGQSIVFSSSERPETIEVMLTGIIETIKTFQKALSAVKQEGTPSNE